MLRLFVSLLTVLTLSVQALSPSDHVSNFRLFDHAGDSHQLHYFSDADAVVLVVQDSSCAASGYVSQQVEQLRSASGEGVHFSTLIRRKIGAL